ncbi:MAG: glycosyltransferase family 2 protein [Limisphaerales bacterium]
MNTDGAGLAVIPCLNEARHIGDVVEGARRHISRVIVVDDGSTDGTAALAASAGAVVLQHPSPRGKGAALATGLSHALEMGAAWALCLDGDGQHSADDIPVFLTAASESGAGLIIGNRFANAPRMPWLRRVVNQVLSRWIGVLVGRAIPDSQCGFRLIRLDLWQRLNLGSRRFEVESEMIVASVRVGASIEFVPVQSVYGVETSKIAPIRDSLRWLRWYVGAIRARATTSKPGSSGIHVAVRPVPAPSRSQEPACSERISRTEPH